jgi:Tfp pilus assembly protein PilV
MSSVRQKRQAGISLVEVLLLLTLMSVTILPVTLLISQNAGVVRSVYIESTRSLFQANVADQKDPLRSDFHTQFHDTTMSTTLVESGQTIPYMVRMDTTNSDALRKTAFLYTYNNTTDAMSAPRSAHQIYQASDVFRLRCGRSEALIDTARQLWLGDGNAYDLSKKQPGFVTGSSGVTGSSLVDIVNTTGVDDGLFQYYREGNGGTNVDYKWDVPNGEYVVSLYFAELNPAVTASNPNRRRMDIYVEGSLQGGGSYSPFETTGGTYRANIQSYEVIVSDNVLDISIRRSATSNHDARISGIVIQKRLIAG